MNNEYLFSILNLYLNRENNDKTSLCLTKYPNGKIKIDFKMNNNLQDTTTFFMEYDVLMSKISSLLDKYKQDLIIIDEKYEYDKLHERCYYYAMFLNSRTLSFKNFSLDEVNQFRNMMYKVNYSLNQLTLDNDNDEKIGYYNNYRLSQVGFASLLSISLVALIILNVLIISLWVLKNFL